MLPAPRAGLHEPHGFPPAGRDLVEHRGHPVLGLLPVLGAAEHVSPSAAEQPFGPDVDVLLERVEGVVAGRVEDLDDDYGAHELDHDMLVGHGARSVRRRRGALRLWPSKLCRPHVDALLDHLSHRLGLACVRAGHKRLRERRSDPFQLRLVVDTELAG
jgi:hypothetical protein